MAEWTIQDAIRPGIRAVQSHWRPLLVIQVVALIVVLAYYRSEWLREQTEVLSSLRSRNGPLFALVAGFLAGSVIPEFARLVSRHNLTPIKDVLFNGFAYGTLGILINAFYDQQSRWFGNGIDVATLGIKTLVDMGIAAPLVFIPYVVVLFEWRKGGFARAKRILSPIGYRDVVLPALLPNWAFWIPVLFCVYAMPQSLQFSLSTLAEAAWSIVFVFIATSDSAQAEDVPISPA
ncbi:MAG TPA: hypothetical protein PKA27_09565 [Fimbriimonadaceae bacterium]|nr:hypothetical protein [Fimbriimonadaceae bacterium]